MGVQADGTPAGATAYDERATRLSQAVTIEPVARISYGAHAGQHLEVFAPRRDTRSRLPVVAFLHGGAWMAGGLHWLRFMAPPVTALPALFVGVSYRLAPKYRWPAQYEDARDAMRCIRRLAPEHGGDPERIVVAGHSAGGHLASMVVLRCEAGAFAGCMPLSSPFDLRYGEVDEASSEARVYKYLLKQRSDDADASPILHVDGNVTPFHLGWGGRDMPHIRRAGEAMRKALAEQPGAVTAHVYPDDDHFATHTRLVESADDWYAQLRALLVTHPATQK
ncbi:MAG: alpha/beta hydrolase [Burkholderiaceae bacterium]|nr:alpha/beta hydrolase [Burkholderiaceae bacterium]